MKELFIQPKASIKDALKQLSKSGKSCLIVVNNTNKLLGTLTDGDVRRVILKGKFLQDKINGIYQKNPILLKRGNYSSNQIKDLFLKKEAVLILLAKKRNPNFLNVLFMKKLNLLIPLVRNGVQQLNQLDLL